MSRIGAKTAVASILVVFPSFCNLHTYYLAKTLELKLGLIRRPCGT
jgi:hypothetical protein